MERWATDTGLALRYGNAVVEVEGAKVETRSAPMERMPLRDFLAVYNKSDAYVVASVPDTMRSDLLLPSVLSCGHVICP